MVTAQIVRIVACLAALNLPTIGHQAPSQAASSTATIKGEVTACNEFRQRFGPDIVFRLRPERDASGACLGWNIEVHLTGDDVNLAEMNQPPHGPSVLDLFAWMFADDASSREHDRQLAFSPEVKSVHLRAARDRQLAQHLYDAVRGVKPFGTCDVHVDRFTTDRANPQHPEAGPEATEVAFRATLTWPSGYTGFSVQPNGEAHRTVTPEQSKSLVLAALTTQQKRLPKIGADRYEDPSSPRYWFFVVTWDNPRGSVVVGHYAVDRYTGDVFNAVVSCLEITSAELRRVQAPIRSSLGLSQSAYLRLKAKGPLCDE